MTKKAQSELLAAKALREKIQTVMESEGRRDGAKLPLPRAGDFVGTAHRNSAPVPVSAPPQLGLTV